MSEEGKNVLGVMVGFAVLLCGMIWLLTPSQMKVCVKAGYDWIDENCVDRD